MMRRIRQRMLAVLLAIIQVVTLLPTTVVYAADEIAYTISGDYTALEAHPLSDEYYVLVSTNHHGNTYAQSFKLNEVQGVHSFKEFVNIYDSGDKCQYSELVTHPPKPVTFSIRRATKTNPSLSDLLSSSEIKSIVIDEYEIIKTLRPDGVTIQLKPRALTDVSKGTITSAISNAVNFGVYTLNWAEHTVDTESNIAAYKITGGIGSEYGYSSNNTSANKIKVTKTFTDITGEPVTNAYVKINLYKKNENSPYKVLDGFTNSNGKLVGTFVNLTAGEYWISETISGSEIKPTDENKTIGSGNDKITVDFGNSSAIFVSPKHSFQYFETLEGIKNHRNRMYDLIKKLRNDDERIIVIGNQADYNLLLQYNKNNTQFL